jgi:hypothetical protein
MNWVVSLFVFQETKPIWWLQHCEENLWMNGRWILQGWMSAEALSESLLTLSRTSAAFPLKRIHS